MQSVRDIIKKIIEENYYTTWKKIEEGSPIDQFKGQETEILNKLTKHLGITKVAPLGQGTSGFAYYIPNNRVLKITKDKTEAAEAFKIKGKNLKHLANIYEVYALHGKYEGTYVIISELLDRSEDIENGRDWLSDFVENTFGHSLFWIFQDAIDGHIDQNKIKEYKKEIRQFARSEYSNNMDPEKTIWFMTGIFGIIEELKGWKIKSTDWGVTNLGIKKNGNLAMFDLGYGDPNLSPNIQNINLNEFSKERDVFGHKYSDLFSQLEYEVDHPKETLNGKIKELKSLQKKNVITLYRVVYIKDIKDLNSKDLGHHYVLSTEDFHEEMLDYLYQNARKLNKDLDEQDLYLIEIQTPSDNIDYYETMRTFAAHPFESEVTIKDGKNVVVKDISNFYG